MKRHFQTMLTDLYELTMMQGYYKYHDSNKTVVFDLFFRKNPWGNGFSIMAGLEQVLDYLDNLYFDDDDINYLRTLGCFNEDFLSYLKSFSFSGDVYAIPEGRLIFPREPIVKIVAPIMEAQLIETTILNILNHQCLIATKASRIHYAAKGDTVLEFGLRRAQGPDAGIYGSRASIIGGCTATSNVLAGELFNIPLSGTHAHSWIMSFDNELEAFRKYASLYPNQCILLVDTFNTLKSGLPNAIKVFKELKDKGIPLKNYGIRLDSGDLAYLSKRAREILDNAGFKDAIISASNDLDEFLIDSLKNQGAKITAWGVGTHLITANGNSSFGGVYKMAAIENNNKELIPKIKLSENIDKVTYPGNKKIFRLYEKESNKIIADYITLENESIDLSKDLLLFDPSEPWKQTTLYSNKYYYEELLIKVYDKGKRIYHSPAVVDMRRLCLEEQSKLWEETRRLVNPHEIYVDLSDNLYNLRKQLLTDRKNVL